jgi:hypothetical protein
MVPRRIAKRKRPEPALTTALALVLSFGSDRRIISPTLSTLGLSHEADPTAPRTNFVVHGRPQALEAARFTPRISPKTGRRLLAVRSFSRREVLSPCFGQLLDSARGAWEAGDFAISARYWARTVVSGATGGPDSDRRVDPVAGSEPAPAAGPYFRSS